MADLLDIGIVAERTGIAPSALRYYERLGLLEPAGRNGLRRTYAPDVVDRLALIVAGRATGFSLQEIADLLTCDDTEIRGRLATKAAELDARIAELTAMRAQLDHALTCEHESVLACPRFRSGMRGMLEAQAGRSSLAAAASTPLTKRPESSVE